MRSVKRTKSGDDATSKVTPNNNKSPAKKNTPTNGGGGVMGWSDTHRLLFAGMILFIFVDHFYLRSQLIVVSQSVVANNNATRNIHNHSTAAAVQEQRREEEKETTSTSTITTPADTTTTTTSEKEAIVETEKAPVVPAVPVQETETTTTTPTEPIYLTPSQRRNRKKWERQKRAQQQQQQQQLQEDSAAVPPPESITTTPESTTDTTVSTPQSINTPETESAGAPPMETEQLATTTETSLPADIPVTTTADTTTLGTTEAITTSPESAETAAADTDSTLSAEAPSIETEQPATTTETSTAEDATPVVEPPPVDTTTVPPPPPPAAKKPKKKKKGRRGRNKKENNPPPVEQEPPQQEQQQPIMTLLSNNADLENMQALSNMTGVPMPTEQQLTPETKMIFLKDTIYWLLRHNEAKQLDDNNSNNSNNIRVPTIPKEKDTFMGVTLGQLKKYHPAIFQRMDAVTLVTILQDIELASGNRTTSTTTTTTDPASTTTSNASSTTTTPADMVDATKETTNPIATTTSMPNNTTTSPPSTITTTAYRTTNSHNDRLVAQINNYHADHNNGTYNYNYTQLELQHYQNHFNKLMRLRKTDIQVFEARGGWKFFFEHVDAYMVSSKDLDYHLEQKQVVTNHDSPVLGNRLNNHLIHVPKHKTSLCHAARIFNQFREHPDTIAQNKSWPHVLLFGLHEDNGGLSGKINGETVGFNRDGEWKKAGCKPRDIIKYLDHPDTIAAITCQWHFRIDHPKTYSIALGMRFRTQAEAAYSVIKKLKPPTDPSWNHRPRKLMLNFNVRGGNRERAMQQIRTNFVNSTSVSTQQSWGGSPKRNLEGYFEQLSEAKFILSPGGAGFDCYRNWEALFMGVVPIIEMVGRSPDGWLRTFNDLPVLVVESFADLTPEMLEEKYLQVLQSWHLFNWEKLTFHWWIHWVYQFLEDNNLPYTRPNAGKPTWGISKVGGSLIK
ncbi:expressed unknown protein [Seminavis robusta]|uniref:RXYLT1 C-terminal domain-containing protein n=1 Tax=Seminavis robusta TaxID=568900 RepID=A0A9N8HK20_9STRA|nr:expressed unknown protein [Seminavis robusta]|eukprot:Sro805_g205010.1 n/a (958) ;mRNA; r:39788-42661